MQPTLATIAPFTIAGLSVRTCNRDEQTPADARIPGLWGRFFAEGVVERLLDRQPDSPVYEVYSGYQSDASGEYDVTLGAAVSQVSPAFANVEVQGGQYLVFEATGPMPQTVIETWGKIWAYFQDENAPKRCFTTDFERYSGADSVAIHIAVEV